MTDQHHSTRMGAGNVCAHLRISADERVIDPESTPNTGIRFHVVFVVDAHLGLTDFLSRCPECDQHYLLELLDWRGAGLRNRLYRMLTVDAKAVERFLYNQARDYCDLTRHQAELHALRTHAQQTELLAETLNPDPSSDASQGANAAGGDRSVTALQRFDCRVHKTDPASVIPTLGWRDRLFDAEEAGRWFVHITA